MKVAATLYLEFLYLRDDRALLVNSMVERRPLFNLSEIGNE